MSGRGVDAERTRDRVQNNTNWEDFNTKDNSDTPTIQFRGSVSTEKIPEKIELTHQHGTSISLEEHGTNHVLADSSKRKLLEAQYETLGAEGGMKVLEEIENGTLEPEEHNTGSFYSSDLLWLMDHQGLIDINNDISNGIEVTDEGHTRYTNWSTFENYLAGEERINSIEDQIRQKRMPDFLNVFLDREITFHDYLTDPQKHKSKWMNNYDSESEMYAAMAVLYGEDINRLGENIRDLETLMYDPEVVDQTTVEELRQTGLRGLTDSNGILTQDGERLYRTVRNDYLSIDL